jgi:GT2 family glycosyltransferase/Flp pilus assembly protein TadD
MVEKAKSLAEKYGIHFFHEPLFKEYAGPRPCVWPETQLMVGFDGEIYPCGGAEVHFKEKVEGGVYPFGNALTHPIEEFWNGEMYRALRISSQAGKDCPIAECKVCANRMNPGDEKAHIMHWDAPSESTFKKEGERIDKIRKEEPEGEFPLVSVIVPTYNRPDMLVETLRSILNQTYSNYEIIIVNDAGVDVENVVTFLNQAGRMTYVRHGRNLGLAAARNTGIKMAKGKYIAYLDDDDLYYPDHLETLLQFLESSEYKVAYTDACRAHQKKVNGRYAVVKQDVPYSFDFDDDRILLENFVPVLCFMHEKSCLDEVGCFDEGLTTLEDWDMWIRMSRKFKFAHIQKVTCEFRWREDGTTMTGEKKLDFFRNTKRIYEKYKEYSKDKPGLSQAQETFFKNFDESIKREYDRIQQLIKKSLIEEAISALEKLLILSPAHSLAHDDLGVLYFHRGDNERALEHFIQSLKADPKNQNAMKNMADLRMELGQMKEALQLYQMVLADQPMDVEALLGVGNYCLRAGRLGDASCFFKQVLEIEPENMAAKGYLDALANPEEEGVSPELRVNGESQPSTALPPKEEKEKIENPKVSIIIPVFNNLNLTHHCLKSILQNTHDLNYQMIIVDNASSDGTTEYLRGLKIPRVRSIFQTENIGFVEACNAGAEVALGDYLLFLNNDTEVQPGWLDSLLQLAETITDCGAVGSKLIYPDGRLQEAGGIIFSDGNGWNYGRGLNPADPRFNFIREVDYCSGAALMVRRTLWREIGGFDRRYAPAYYEDTDLCFEIRKRGYKVYYQPQSMVIHHEGKTAGIDLQSGYKKYQSINRFKFIGKWVEELKNQFPNDPRNVVRASNRHCKKSILVVDPFLPFFDRASGSLRLFQILKLLKEMGFHVTFIARNGSMEGRYKRFLEDMGIEVYAWDPKVMEVAGYRIENCKPISYDLLFQERQFEYAMIDFWDVAEYYLPLVRKLSPKTQIIVDTVDIHFLRKIREAELKKSEELKQKALADKDREIAIYKRADRLWVVTEEDKKMIEGHVGKTPIDIIPNIHKRIDVRKKFEETSDLLFVGNFNHPPNQDAIQYCCGKIFPLILKDLSNVKLYVVGNNPPEEVKALASDRIIVRGYVEDLAPYLRKARISVNPLRYGAGMKGKIGEALSWGLPVVTSSIGAEGMDLTDGKDALIADTPEDFVAKVVRLYNDPELWGHLSINGKTKVEEQWSPEAMRKRLESVFVNPGLPREIKLVSIIILAYNQVEYTRKCLDSIFKYTEEPFELIVVDNGSTDRTAEYLNGVGEGSVEVGGWRLKVYEKGRTTGAEKALLEEENPRRKGGGKGKKKRKDLTARCACQNFKVIRNEENRGFAGGNNQGIAAAMGDYILLINNDVVVTPGWLGRLIACSEQKPQIGIVGPVSNYVSGPQQVKGVAYPTDTLENLNQFAQDYAKQHQGQYRPFWRVVGFCMLIKQAVVEKIGGLDGRYGLGNFEDDDFSLRATLAGFESWIAEDCYVHHFGNRTFVGAQINYRESLNRNWEIFKRKWGIPTEVGYGTPYDMGKVLRQGFMPDKHYCPLNPKEYTVAYGEELFSSGEVEGAKTIFHKILHQDPQNVEALNNLGVISFQQGEIDEAGSYFAHVLGIEPNYFESIENMGNCLVAKKTFSEAIGWFKKALEMRPDEVGLLNSLANCFVQIENFAKAEEVYEKSYRIDGRQTSIGEILGELERMKPFEAERRANL